MKLQIVGITCDIDENRNMNTVKKKHRIEESAVGKYHKT